jgi:hypothetical protein
MPRLLNKASQALSLAGPWQWLRGYWLAPVNITGCCMSVWPVVRCAHLVSTPLRLKPSRPSGARNPRYVLRPAAPARGTSLQLVPRPIPKHVLAMASPSPQGSKPGAARGLEGWPRPTTHRPRGAPQPHATTERSSPPLAGQRSAVLPASRVRFAALRAPLTRLRAPLCGVGQRRSP